MARRYDQRTTIFSPEGRVYQVEYAMTAIRHAGATVGILAKDGIVLAAEKKTTAKLLDSSTSISEKMFKIDEHVVCAVAGITSDANILINYARLSSQRFFYQYQEPMPVEQLVSQICDTKQGYTQYGGLRPFGVSFLYAGWDRHYGFQLYQSDPSGNFAGWKATSIGGENSQVAQSVLRSNYKPDISLKEALQLALKVLTKTMDRSNINSEKLEFSYFTKQGDNVVYHIFTAAELDAFIKETDLEQETEDN
ncbi:proteasome subunit alpha type 4 [Dictyostelium discoideum AX4]|uniref:Proteasome subunit alpha type-4 n=1 Tax=Dictyostelium discoideum TaxID=44689 RepID=PSA4_DICDI|nr:proteasome subunit alpha type 4 [Dictyostelium discoideum AX4]P34119.1 RecName: Full=Proteasome subunit alpha type-4; AltName: Full=Proteasome component DD4 [Dictyostelium discoideum]AAA33233.1 proteasome [Dictyostelium discoideum]EAL66781.1 proteasome subunit alpha type 4 [Dictyostelium discoideum AX4]|eukprot:XP_640858.1 proteasome subunit alpha type 4 [Dictyostelium discoideum AX4]